MSILAMAAISASCLIGFIAGAGIEAEKHYQRRQLLEKEIGNSIPKDVVLQVIADQEVSGERTDAAAQMWNGALESVLYGLQRWL